MKELLSILCITALTPAGFGFDAVFTDDATLNLSGKPMNLGGKPVLMIDATHAALLKFDLIPHRKERLRRKWPVPR